MKTRNTIILFFCIILAAFALGAAGLINIIDESAQAVSGSDRLIGVLITKEPLFSDLDLLLAGSNNMPRDGESTGEAGSAGNQGRLYARPVVTSQTETCTETDYVFDKIDGIRFFKSFVTEGSESFLTHCIDEEITDIESRLSEDNLNDEKTTSLEGTVYYAAIPYVDTFFYLNPVYQTPEGDVYAVSGDELRFHEKSSQSLTLTDSQTETSNGRKSTSTQEVTVNLLHMDKPTGTSLLQFDSENKLLEKTDLDPRDQQDHIDALPGAQYMILETRSVHGISRTVYQREDDSLYAFYCRHDRFCIKHDYDIYWSD